MVRVRCWALPVVALTLLVQPGWSDEQPVKQKFCPTHRLECLPGAAVIGVQAAPQDHTCAIYSLAELGDDPSLGKWIAETIPQVIEPGSWSSAETSGKKHVLSYFAPKKVLVVYHTPAVQAKVAVFLKGLKETLPSGKDRTYAGTTFRKDHGVVRAGYQTPDIHEGIAPAPTAGYPVPAQAHQPKHLFHFIIRYEGAGIIDDSVIKFMKVQNADKASKEVREDTGDAKPRQTSYAPSCGPAVVCEPVTGGDAKPAAAQMTPADAPVRAAPPPMAPADATPAKASNPGT